MLGYSVESGDFNLPVDAVTEKPLCAYSLNRKIRETYDGQFFDFIDKDGSGSYPSRTPSVDLYQVGETTTYPKITKIYDQKTRHEMPVRDVDVDMGIGENAEGKFYMTFDSSSTFDLPIAGDMGSRVGVLAVADPDPDPSARSPLVTFQGETEQLALDLNPGYTRFYLYTEEEKHDIMRFWIVRMKTFVGWCNLMVNL